VYGILTRKSSEMRAVRFVDILTTVEYIILMPALVQDRDTQKKMIGEHLKAADRFIKAAEFPKALEEVTKALAVEPNNMYALAYNERIKVAMEAARKKEDEDRLKKLAEDQKKSAATVPSKPVESGPRAPNMPDAKPLPANSPSPVPVPPPAIPVPSLQPAIPADDLIVKIRKEAEETAEAKAQEQVELLKQEFTVAQMQLQKDIIQLATQAKEAEEKRAALGRQLAEQTKQFDALRAEAPSVSTDAPRQLLKVLFEKAWEDGTISDEERSLLKAAGDSIGLSDEELISLEMSTQSSAYYAVMREVWKDGVVTPEEADHLENLRKSLNVSAEEHLKLESQIRRETHAKK
jgi:hypothetical protein